jgi:hypothetical protein
MKVNGRIAGQIKTEDHEAKQALYDHGGHPHVHEEVPIDLLILDTEHQFQVFSCLFYCYLFTMMVTINLYTIPTRLHSVVF